MAECLGLPVMDAYDDVVYWDDETPESVTGATCVPVVMRKAYVIRIEWPEETVIMYFDDWNDRQKTLIEVDGWLHYETYEIPNYKGPMMTIIESNRQNSLRR